MAHNLHVKPGILVKSVALSQIGPHLRTLDVDVFDVRVGHSILSRPEAPGKVVLQVLFDNGCGDSQVVELSGVRLDEGVYESLRPGSPARLSVALISAGALLGATRKENWSSTDASE